MAEARSLRLMLVALVGALVSGCASYYTHYAMFPAETSSGKTRDVRISWDSAEYPGWWITHNRTTTMTLETQCSERVWRLADDSHEQAGNCGKGIRACADRALDQPVVTDVPGRCLSVRVPGGGDRIAAVGSQFELQVSCQPIQPTLARGDETVNVDYLRPSSVPYQVYARKVPRGSLSASLPEFNARECRDD